MKVEQINSRELFGEFGPRAPKETPEGREFLTKVFLTTCLPAIAFSLVMDSSVLLACFIVEQATGAICGWLLYKQPPRLPVHVVPVDVNPTVPAQVMKEAA
jgi:hypothetical protein